MSTLSKTLVDLEKKFWRSIVDTDSALKMLLEPAVMVSSHGAIKFDHAGYRKMAEHGSMLVTSFDLSNVATVFPNDTTAILTYRVKQTVAPRGRDESTEQEMNDSSTWIRTADGWKCVMHTETPVDSTASTH